MSGKTNERLLIGLDADVEKSGMAVWDPNAKVFVQLSDYSLFELFVKLNDLHQRFELMVYLEDANLIRAVWHKKGGIGAAKNVGKNMAIAKQIRVFMDSHHIQYQLLKPAGYSKYDHRTFCSITGWPAKERTNPEKRAAAMMVFGRTK